jgi:hypothetical protein
VYAGAYLTHGWLLLACEPSLTCSGTSLRLGAMVAYTFFPTSRLRPWFGVGVGYHLDGRSVGTSVLTTDTKASGVDFVVAQAGLDVGIQRFAVGPFAALLMGTDMSSSVTLAGTRRDADADTYLRGYFLVGARGTLDL